MYEASYETMVTIVFISITTTILILALAMISKICWRY
jgi:hypothetical protein